MVLEIPDSAVQDMPMSPAEILLEVAIWLYQSKRISLGQARKMTGLSIVAFQKELAAHGLYLNYDLEDFQNDMQVARSIK